MSDSFGSFDMGGARPSGTRSSDSRVVIGRRKKPASYRSRRKRSVGSSAFWGWMLLLVLVVLILVVVNTIFFYSADVELSPNWKSFSVSSGIVAAPYGADVNEGDVVFYDVVKVSNKYKVGEYNVKSVKKIFNRARGVVTLYNEMGSDQKLANNTRLRSESGKIYYIVDKDVVIPAGSREEPGSVDVEVVAESYGADYNMESGNFVFPGWEESGRMDRFRYQYAVVKEPIVGGEVSENIYEIDGEVVVGDDLIDKIRSELLVLAKDNIDTLTENLVIPDTNSFKVSDDFEYGDYDEGQNKVSVYVDAELSLLSAKLSDVEKHIVDLYRASNPRDVYDYFVYWQDLYDKFYIKDYLGGKSILDSSSVVLGVSEGNIVLYPALNEERVAGELVGRKKSEVGHILKNYAISGYNVRVYPPWMWRFPSSVDRISVDVLYPYEEENI